MLNMIRFAVPFWADGAIDAWNAQSRYIRVAQLLILETTFPASRNDISRAIQQSFEQFIKDSFWDLILTGHGANSHRLPVESLLCMLEASDLAPLQLYRTWSSTNEELLR